MTYGNRFKKVNKINDLITFLLIIKKVAGVKGLEPSTYRVTGDRSNQLSYTPTLSFWWVVKDSNL